MEDKRKGAERLTPKPLPKRPKLTKEELAARPAPRKPPKRNKSQAAKRRERLKKARIPKDQAERLRLGREKMLKDKADNKLIQVGLKTFHIFGEEQFGPGTSWVPQRLLLAVLEQDRRAVEAENQLFVERAHMIVKGRGATAAVQVAPQNFKSVWESNPPIYDQVSGRGVQNGEGARF